MTIRKTIETELINHGMWPNEAKSVMIEFEMDGSSEAMRGRWDDVVEGYPPQLLSVLLMGAKQKAVEWIDNNKPNHFAKHILSA